MNRPCRLIAFVAVLLTAGIVHGQSAPASSAKSASTQPERAKSRWQRFTDQGKFATHRQLVKSLRNGSIGPDAVEAFEFVVREQARRNRIRQWARLLDGPRKESAIQWLYAELMLADSDPDLLYESCVANIERTFEQTAINPHNYAGFFSWSLSRSTMACIIGYEATRQPRFLELVASTFERTLPFRDSELGRIDHARGKAMSNWGTNRYAGKDQYGTEITTIGRVTYPVLRLVHFVRNDSSLQDQFGERAERYLAIVRQSLDEYRNDYRNVPGTNQGYYLHLTKQLAEALNHMSWAGNGLLTLGQITGDSDYQRMAEGIGHYMRASMSADEHGCLTWNYAPQPNDRSMGREWVWKAGTTIDLPLYFAKHNVVFTRHDMEKITNTFLTNIHQGEHRWNALLTREFKSLSEYRESGGLLCLTHFIELDRYDPKVRRVIEDMVATHPEVGGWLRGSYAVMAYAHRLIQPGFNAETAGDSLNFVAPVKGTERDANQTEED